MNKHIQTAKGMNDLLPESLAKIEHVESIFLRTAKKYGFMHVQTPVLELAEIFSSTLKIPEERCYSLTDGGGRKLFLKNDPCPPLIRLVASHFRSAPKPVKLVYCDRVFRPWHVHRREFRMFGLSTFGIEQPAADAEIIRVVADVVAEVGLPGFRITYNNLNIFRSLITSAISDLPASQNIDDILYDLRFAVDTEALISKLATSHHLPSNVIDAILSLMECRGEEAEAYELLVRLGAIFSAIIPELEKTLAFQEALRNQGFTNTMLNVSNLHGTGFYSGLTYQTSLENRLPEIGDGGRYDQMMFQMHGEAMSATGLGLGIERFLDLLEGGQSSYKFPQPTQSILVAFEQPSVAVSCRKVLQQLRLADRFVEEDLVNRSFDKTVRYAKSKKCNRVALVKSAETDGAVQLRIINLDSDSSVTLSAADQQELFNILLGC